MSNDESNVDELPTQTPGASSYGWMLLATDILTMWWPICTILFGIFGNILSLLVTTKKDNSRISTCVYMAGLACVDTCVLIAVALYKLMISHRLGEGMDESLLFLRFVVIFDMHVIRITML
jgi:hypothetical protein